MIVSVHQAYREIAADDGAGARSGERHALARSIEMMRRAEESGPSSHDSVEALLYTQRLWSVLVEDLASPDNRLPVKLRADLISIGLWILREVEDIRSGSRRGFKALIDTSTLILGGLD
jgi:flagellar protein FlaF